MEGHATLMPKLQGKVERILDKEITGAFKLRCTESR